MPAIADGPDGIELSMRAWGITHPAPAACAETFAANKTARNGAKRRSIMGLM